MLEDDQLTGIGVSLDPNMYKYVGLHKNGERNGYGILFYPDGRVYEGAWS